MPRLPAPRPLLAFRPSAPLWRFLLIGMVLYLGHKSYAALATLLPDRSHSFLLQSAPPAAPAWPYPKGYPLEPRQQRLLEEQALSEQLLLEEAFRAGHHLEDPVVRARLVRNMRFLEPDSEAEEATLLRRALELGMHRQDPVVRRRLVQLHTRLTTRALELPAATAEELSQAAQQLGLEESYQRRRFRQVLVSRGEPEAGLGAQERALQLLRRLRQAPRDGAWETLGDPHPAGDAAQALSQRQAAARFGAGFAAQLFQLPLGSWQGPLSSPYGWHLVFVYGETSEVAQGLRPLLEHTVREGHRRRQAAKSLAELRRRGAPP